VDAIDVGGGEKKNLEWTVYRCKTLRLPDVTFMAGLHIWYPYRLLRQKY